MVEVCEQQMFHSLAVLVQKAQFCFDIWLGLLK